jgi:hypothetical protein
MPRVARKEAFAPSLQADVDAHFVTNTHLPYKTSVFLRPARGGRASIALDVGTPVARNVNGNPREYCIHLESPW